MILHRYVQLLIIALVCAFLGAGGAAAQSTRFQGQLIGSRGLPLANQNVAVCTQPAVTTTQPCSPLATLSTSLITTSGGANPFTTDSLGNFFFYAVPGTYTLQFYGPQVGTPYVQPDMTVGAGGAGAFTTITVSGTATFTGPVTIGNGNAFSPFTFSNHNAVYWAGPGALPTIDQAVTACGANPCFVEISPTYSGPESVNLLTLSTGHKVYSGALNVTIIDRRFNTSGSQPNYPVLYGSRLAGQLVRMGVNGWAASPIDSTAGSTSFNWFTGTYPSNSGTQNGGVGVIISHDSVVEGTANAPMVGQDGECDVTATSFDIPRNFCYGTNSQTNIIRANATQSIINAVGSRTAANSNASSSGAVIVNSYGAYHEAQNAGTSRNFSQYNRGNELFDTETQIHSLINGAAQTVTAATESGQTVTLTVTGCTVALNQEVVVAGITPTAYNGRYFAATACSAGSFTYIHPTSSGLGAGTIFGTVVTLTPSSTTYFRNTNSIQHNLLSDTIGEVWQSVAGNPIYRYLAASITSFVPHEFAARLILDEIAPPSGSATQGLVWSGNDDHLVHYNPNNAGIQQVPEIIALTSQYTNSTAGFTNVAGGNTIQWTVAASRTYTAECHLYYQAAATGGLNIEFTGPAAPTNVIYGLNDPSAPTAFNSAVATAYSTSLGQVVGTAATNYDAVISFSLLNGVNAGTVNLLAKSSAAVQLQIQAGSWCRVQ